MDSMPPRNLTNGGNRCDHQRHLDFPDGQAKNMDRLKFDSLDTYMLTMYGEVYAEALLSIASFGERVQKAMEQNQEDGVWCIQMPFLITNEKWTCLCKRVRFLVRIIKRKVLSLESCPSHEKLNLAVQKLSLIF